ncbi:MAG TPA: type IV toxin-antitoxin system AbiEi family antitoxin [Actinomycetota bacterium]|nr:type IV toxin-antitoxin system AbiEi family antitoxin [Actinomycetota bacterium]
MSEKGRLSDRVEAVTKAVLPMGLRVKVTKKGNGSIPLFDVAVGRGAAVHRFVGCWVGEGWPGDVERLSGLTRHPDVVYAQQFSEGARAWLADHHLGWIDEAGGAHVSLPSGLVVVRDQTRATVPAAVPQGWTSAMLTAAEAVLAGNPPVVMAIEQATALSRGAATNALARLERVGLLSRPGALRGPASARQVVDIDAFIDAYAAAAAGFRAKQQRVLIHRIWRDPLQALAREIAPSMAAARVKWAISGAAASTLLAPYLSDVTVIDLYVERSLIVAQDHLAQLLHGRVVQKGHRIEVRELPTSMSANGPRIDGIQVALPGRVYADLLASGGRLAEAAHHLREVHGAGPRS